jgi:hypothetical protein
MNKLEVKGLTHKICLIDTLYEMYQVNIDNMNFFTREIYSRIGEKTLSHYDWLKSVFLKFDDAEKKNFKDLFSNAVHTYHLINETVALPDDASVSDVQKVLINSETPEIKTLKELLEKIPDTYLKAYSDYFNSFKAEFDNKAEKIQNKATEHRFDILSFMEDQSGIKFSEFAQISGFTFPDTVKYYFTFRPIGAMGFHTPNSIVSTVQGSNNDLTGIVSTPFHEFSHSLFKTFTLFDDFKEISSDLKNHKELFDFWHTKTKNHYDWNGWVEENLVEGFSKYLNRKYRELFKVEIKDTSKTYVLDKLFADHLISSNFNPSNDKLKEVAFEFLKTYSYSNKVD